MFLGLCRGKAVAACRGLNRAIWQCLDGNLRQIFLQDSSRDGMNRQLDYESPADIVDRYPQFYWNSAAPHIQTEIRYLNMTSSGRHWIAGLYGNVFRAEREISLSGPQK